MAGSAIARKCRCDEPRKFFTFAETTTPGEIGLGCCKYLLERRSPKIFPLSASKATIYSPAASWLSERGRNPGFLWYFDFMRNASSRTLPCTVLYAIYSVVLAWLSPFLRPGSCRMPSASKRLLASSKAQVCMLSSSQRFVLSSCPCRPSISETHLVSGL